MGLAAGAGIGAAVGVVPAFFTFGLSIPVGALMGGVFGFCTGTVVGGSTGLVSGGVAGHYGYERRDDIKGAVKNVTDQGNTYVLALRQRASATQEHAISVMRSTGCTGIWSRS